MVEVGVGVGARVLVPVGQKLTIHPHMHLAWRALDESTGGCPSQRG